MLRDPFICKPSVVDPIHDIRYARPCKLEIGIAVFSAYFVYLHLFILLLGGGFCMDFSFGKSRLGKRVYWLRLSKNLTGQICPINVCKRLSLSFHCGRISKECFIQTCLPLLFWELFHLICVILRIRESQSDILLLMSLTDW